MIRRWIRKAIDWTKDSASFLVERPHRLGIVLVAAGIGAAAGYPPGDAGYDFMWKHPDACIRCHVHDYANEAYFRSVHAGVTTCHDCHVVPLVHLMAEGLLMVTDRPETPEDIGPTHVAAVLCETCHVAGHQGHLTGPMPDEMVPRIVKVDQSPLHKVHLEADSRDPGAYLGSNHGTDEGAALEPPDDQHEGSEGEGHGAEGGHGAPPEGVVCIDCHGSGGNEASHRFTASRQNCLECHGGVDVAIGRLTELRCQECHFSGFVGTRSEGASTEHAAAH